MTLLLALPYAEAIAAQWLRAQYPGGGAKVFSSLPTEWAPPLFVIKRIGGTSPVPQWLDAPRLQIESWGSNKTEAWTRAEVGRRVLLDMVGRVFSAPGDAGDAVVTGVRDELGFTWLPDQTTSRDRYIFGLGVILHPKP